MDVFKAYALGTSAWLSTQSLPLLLTPKLIVSLLAVEPRRITDLESYLCRSFGLALVALSALNLILTGVIPLATTASEELRQADGEGNIKDPYAYPTLTITTAYHALTAFYLYAQLTYVWNFAFTAGLVGTSALFCLGVWVILFGSEKGKISKSTGADKRTSNFPFRNEESAREKKKESKRRSITKTKSRD